MVNFFNYFYGIWRQVKGVRIQKPCRICEVSYLIWQEESAKATHFYNMFSIIIIMTTLYMYMYVVTCTCTCMYTSINKANFLIVPEAAEKCAHCADTTYCHQRSDFDINESKSMNSMPGWAQHGDSALPTWSLLAARDLLTQHHDPSTACCQSSPPWYCWWIVHVQQLHAS